MKILSARWMVAEKDRRIVIPLKILAPSEHDFLFGNMIDKNTNVCEPVSTKRTLNNLLCT